MQLLTIVVRGAAGSGKSTMARELYEKHKAAGKRVLLYDDRQEVERSGAEPIQVRIETRLSNDKVAVCQEYRSRY
jgi:Flp pilus assembly CpaF family ATPase